MLKKSCIVMLIIFLISMSLAACRLNENKRTGTSPQQSTINSSEINSQKHRPEQVEFSDLTNPKIVNETKYYKIFEGDNFKSYYYVYDSNHRIVDERGFDRVSPKIKLIDNNLVKVYVQTGTGAETAWTFYYSVKSKLRSRILYGVLDEYGTLVVCIGKDNDLIVEDMFDKKVFKEFKNLDTKIAAGVAIHFTNAKFIKNGNMIEVTYFTSNDLVEKKETLTLN